MQWENKPLKRKRSIDHDQRAHNWYRDDLYPFFVVGKEVKDRSLFESLSKEKDSRIDYRLTKLMAPDQAWFTKFSATSFFAVEFFFPCAIPSQTCDRSSNLSNTSKLLFSCKVQTSVNAVPWKLFVAIHVCNILLRWDITEIRENDWRLKLVAG